MSCNIFSLHYEKLYELFKLHETVIAGTYKYDD